MDHFYDAHYILLCFFVILELDNPVHFQLSLYGRVDSILKISFASNRRKEHHTEKHGKEQINIFTWVNCPSKIFNSVTIYSS